MIYRRALSLTAFLGFLCFFVAGPAAAEPRVGRMSDGTPYRTDSEGNQLADHIAELEVTIIDLRQQIAALEDELEKNQIANVKASRNKEATGAIVSHAKPGEVTDRGEVERLRISEASCLRTKMLLEQNVSKLRQNDTPVGQASTNCDSQTAILREQITQLQNALMDSPSKERLAGAVDQRNKLEASVAQANMNLSERDSAMRNLQSQLAEASSEISRLQGNLLAREEREKELLQQVANFQQHTQPPTSVPASDIKPVYSTKDVARASMINSESQPEAEVAVLDAVAIKETKKSFRSTLSTIQSLILQRKALLDGAKKNRREISVRVQSLVTKRGDSLDALRIQVDKFATMAEADSVRQGLGEIKGILDQDVSLLKRLS